MLKKIATILIILLLGIALTPSVFGGFKTANEIDNEFLIYDKYNHYEDTLIYNGTYENTTFYGSHYLTCDYEAGWEKRIILFFPNITVDYANVTIYVHLYGNAPSSEDFNVSIYRLTNHYDPTFVSWTNRTENIPWSTSGGDYNSTELDNVFVTSITYYHYYWDVTDFYWAVSNGTYTNYGFIIKTIESGHSTFYSSNKTGITDEKLPSLLVQQKYYQPELKATSYKITPNNPMANTTIDLNVTIENRGNVDSEQFNISYFIDDVLIQNTTISGISGNYTIIYDNITYDASGKWSNHTFKVQIDSLNETFETNENNNNITIDIFFIYSIYEYPNEGQDTDLYEDVWNLEGYSNLTSKLASAIYSDITHCEALSWKNDTSGWWYTYWPGIGFIEDELINFGDGLFILVDADTTWDHV